MKARPLILSLLFLLVIGCSSNEDESTRAQSGDGHPWETQMRALDKARAIEQTLQDSAEEQRRRLKQQTQ